jgi:cytochrome c oxidase assembly protein subunit 15
VAALMLCRKLPRAAAMWIVGLIAVQIGIGVADLVELAPVVLQVLHLLGADLFWIALVAVSSDVLFGAKKTARDRLTTAAAAQRI